jgi:hypothetical protein
VSKSENLDGNYGDRWSDLARRPHDVWSAWIVAALLGLGLVLASGDGSPPVGQEVARIVAASGSSDSMPLAEQIGMSLERVR